MGAISPASRYRMALLTVSKPKPECSRSNSANSQPADFRMWPIPGVANSTMKWPSFRFLERVISFRPVCILLHLPSLDGHRCPVGRPLACEIAYGYLLVGDMLGTSPAEQVIM